MQKMITEKQFFLVKFEKTNKIWKIKRGRGVQLGEKNHPEALNACQIDTAECDQNIQSSKVNSKVKCIRALARNYCL